MIFGNEKITSTKFVLKVVFQMKFCVPNLLENFRNFVGILLHYIAPTHKTISAQEFWAKKATNDIDQTPYSPNMAPYDLFMLPKPKLPLRGWCFESIEAINPRTKNAWIGSGLVVLYSIWPILKETKGISMNKLILLCFI